MLRQLINAVLLGGIAALVLAGRIHLYGEEINERTAMIVRTAGLAGAAAGLVLTPFFERNYSMISRWQASAAFFWVFLGAMMAFYVVHNAAALGRPDRIPDVHLYLPLRQMARIAGQFMAFAPKYLVFGPLPLLVALAALVLPGLPPRKG